MSLLQMNANQVFQEETSPTMEDEGWDDEYSDEEEDDMRQSSPMNKSLDDLRDEFGFSDCTNLMFSNTTIEEPVESDDSEDDDDETRPLQFDDSSPIPSPANSRLLPSTSCPTSPFWFGDEDSAHLQRLFSIYEKAIGLDKEKNMVKRGDMPFVGRVLRRQVKDMANKGDFWTVDALDVYLNEFVPLGMTLPLTRHVHTLTKWDVHSGLPVECKVISRKIVRSQWKPHSNFSYSSARQESPMRVSNDQPFCYQQFLPRRSHDEEEAQFMLIGSPGSSPNRPPPKFSF